MIYLDTHVVVWLYAGLEEKFSDDVRRKMNDNELVVSSMVRLELQYLYEIGRVTAKPDKILGFLSRAIGVRETEVVLGKVIDVAVGLSWTRDPFDRLIVAEAMMNSAMLVTADKNIGKHYELSLW